MTKPERCTNCQNINTADRREADALYRGQVMEKLKGYDAELPKIETAIILMSTTMQKNFNNIYFRIGIISGGSGIIGGIVAAIAINALK